MAFSLHQQLKEHYARANAQFEVPVDRYRIDVVNGRQLFEIQHGTLAAIREKVQALVHRHTVHVVKPIIARKRLIKRDRHGGRVVSRRWSPKRGGLLDLFDGFVHFTRAFPHPRLALHVPLVEIEEWRYPGHGKRRWRRPGDYLVEDRRLTGIIEEHTFRRATDFHRLLPETLPRPFNTGQLAEELGIERWLAQRIAYCLRETGGCEVVGKQGNARLYDLVEKAA